MVMPTMRLPHEFAAPLLTQRLLIRPLTADDVDDVHAYQSRPDVCRYLLFDPRTREEVRAKLAEYSGARVLSGDGDFWQLGVERLDEPGRVIGDVFFAIADTANAGAEIGWTLHPDHGGEGYMTEAAIAVLDIAFNAIGLHRAVAKLDPNNHASAALCRRLGMRPEAHFVGDLWLRGAWDDTAVFAILEREWAALRA